MVTVMRVGLKINVRYILPKVSNAVLYHDLYVQDYMTNKCSSDE